MITNIQTGLELAGGYMTAEFFTVMAVIAVLSVVQSVFGMGVLIFGTPTLLLLGYHFTEAICLLVPASFVISLLQLTTSRQDRVAVSRNLYLICLPGIGIGLWIIQGSVMGSWVNILIGAVMLVSAVLRLWPRSDAWLSGVVKKHSMLYHAVMGLVHGLTNLGGALLAILATGQHSEKGAIRYTVAHYYLAFGSVQISRSTPTRSVLQLAPSEKRNPPSPPSFLSSIRQRQSRGTRALLRVNGGW